MPSYAQSIPLPWNEADSFRETTLQNFYNPEDRDALRRLGQVLYSLAVAAPRELVDEESGTEDEESSIYAELRAIAADLRYTSGYCAMVGRMAEVCSLDAPDEALARFAAKLAGRLAELVESIERRLS